MDLKESKGSSSKDTRSDIEDGTPKLTDDETSSDDEKYEDVEEIKEKKDVVLEEKIPQKREVVSKEPSPKNTVVIQKKSDDVEKKEQDLTDEERKMLENFVVKNLDTNEVTTLLDVVKTAKNPIYTQLIGKVKDYEIVENYIETPTGNSVPSTPTTEKKEEKDEKEDKGETKKELKKNVWDSIFRRKGSEIKLEPKKQPLKYKQNNKSIKQFENLKVAQKITGHAGAIWTMKFNKNGQYLASGGQDGYVIIWKINIKKKKKDEKEEKVEKETNWICEEPLQKFLGGQSGDVLDLAWSTSDFILTSTMDKKVRAWHISRKECLGVFVHQEIVTGIQFHPLNETYFITGSFDEKLRLYNLRERELIHFIDTKYMITTVGFNADGKIAMAGTYDGKCLFYNTDEKDGFKKITLLDVRSRRGKNKARKVTGITLSKDKESVLISTNDSRIRLYSLHDYSLNCKYSGLINNESQIGANFSPNGEFIISGSEDQYTYIWNTNNDYFPQKLFTKFKKDKNVSFESFSDHSSIVTNACFAPFDYYSKIGREDKEEKNNTSSYVIVTGDFKGEIRIFENK